MWTEQEQRILGKELLQKKRKAILVSLNSFVENYRKETSPELNQIWVESLSHLSLEQIAKGTKLCLQEVEYFPTVAIFLEKATQRSKESDRWQDKKPDPDQQQIEHHHKRAPMPKEFRNLFKDYLRKSGVK